MKKRLSFLILALLVLPLMLQPAKTVSAQEWSVGIRVGYEPPPLPIYDQPMCPGPDYIWTPGYWAWDPDDGYYWVPGTWVFPPQQGLLWTPGWWGWDNDGDAFVWHEGYWAPEVGFYGGINYGYGYFGNGFYGGRWEGGHFFYNDAVWHVDQAQVHNVYRDQTVINNTTIVNNYVSYNGGQGGVTARPSPQQEQVARSVKHIAPVPAQTQQVKAARSDPQLRATANQGRPPVAATVKPGELSGHGAVQAKKAGGEYHAPPPGRANQPAGGAANRGTQPGGKEAQPGATGAARPVQPSGGTAQPNNGSARPGGGGVQPGREENARPGQPQPNATNPKQEQEQQKTQQMEPQRRQEQQTQQTEQQRRQQQMERQQPESQRQPQTERQQPEPQRPPQAERQQPERQQQQPERQNEKQNEKEKDKQKQE
jgi:hypothetical protein